MGILNYEYLLNFAYNKKINRRGIKLHFSTYLAVGDCTIFWHSKK